MIEQTFFKGKKILVTGHTGFKGSWLCELLLFLGAEVTGYSLEPPTTPSLYQTCRLEYRMHSVYGDIRDLEKLRGVLRQTRPELVLHMAAQPIVRESYRNPVYTYEGECDGHCEYFGMPTGERQCQVFFECNHGQGISEPGVGLGISGE